MAGVAVPEDEECRLKCDLSPEELARRQHAYRRLAIHPDDWEAFDRGEMVGYDDAGRPIPGPNWCGGLADYEGGVEEEPEVLA